MSVTGCAFLRLRGALAGPEGFVAFGPDRGLVLGVDDRAGVDPDALARIVAAPAFEITRDVPDGDALGLWLALHDPAYCHRSDDRPEPLLTESPRFVFTGARYRFTMGLLEGDAHCLSGLTEVLG